MRSKPGEADAVAQDGYLVLARKWRPQNFEDVIGQEHITRTLQNAIRLGRVGHAFLFIGTRGVGKTTTARILARSLNCLSADGPTPEPCGTCPNCVSIAAGNNIDVVEIDGASNNGVDNVREIRENIRMVPSSSRYKIYIIDEVHQLSLGAFNALLKTLEEPPAHAVFILATTETHKVPATIVSRCQRYDFRRVGRDSLGVLLRAILEKEAVRCSEEALAAIVRAADGSVRDGESILEQVISFCGDEIGYDDVFNVLGLVDWKVLHTLCDAIVDKDIARQLTLIEEVVAAGKDLSQFLQDILRYFRNLLVCKTADARSLLALPEDETAEMEAHAARFSLTALIRMVEQFAELSKDFDSQLAQRIALESLLIRMSKVSVEMSVDAVLEKLVLLGAGGFGASPPPESPPNPEGAAAKSLPPQRAAAEPSGDTPSPPRRRVRVTESSMGRVWEDAVHEIASEVGLGAGISLGQGTPSAVEDGTLVVTFPARHAAGGQTAADPAVRDALDLVLREKTDLTGFRAVVLDPEVEEAEEPSTPRPAAGRIPAAGLVNPDEARKALENPHIAQVLDVFRGMIVDIRHHIQADGVS
jgi:DNA polymerase III subunit gamma/tau